MKIGENLQAYKTERFMDRFVPNNKSVIRDIKPSEAIETIKKIKDDIQNNWRLHENTHDEVVFWNKKVASSWEIADLAENFANEVLTGQADNQFTACFLNDHIIGIMAWTQDEEKPGLYIDAIFSHPGVRGAGTLLIEHLVNMSEYINEKGIINLDITDQNAAEAYLKLGFRYQDNSTLDMQLHPKDHKEQWKKNADGEWKFHESLA